LDALEERGFDSELLQRLGKGEYLIRNFQNGANIRGKIDLTQNNPQSSVETESRFNQAESDEEPGQSDESGN
jgi:hypothetical protein